MKRIKTIIGILLIILTITSCNNSVTKNSDDPFVSWDYWKSRSCLSW